MFDLFKNTQSGEKPAVRALTSPEELMVGDIIKFQFLPQPELSGRQFEVAAITTYDFEHENYPRFALQDDKGLLIFLSVHNRQGKSVLAISRQADRDEVDAIFTLDKFAEVFEEGSVTLTATPYAPLASWLGSSYYKALDCRVGYLHIGDYRNQPLPEYEDDSEGIDYYLLRDSSEQFAIDIEIGDNDDSSVYVTVYQPLTAIAEMWPAKG